MPEGRCDLVLLGWTAFVGFNLISDMMWSGRQSYEDRGSHVNGNSPTLYRGNYKLFGLRNGSSLGDGTLRLTSVSQAGALSHVRVASLAMDLSEGSSSVGTFSNGEGDLLFSGVKLESSSLLTASGTSDPTKLRLFGSHPCRLDAIVGFNGVPPDSLTQGDASLDAAGKNLGAVATGSAQEMAGSEATQTKEDPLDVLGGAVTSVHCDFSLRFQAMEVDVVALSHKVLRYSVIVNILTLLQIRFYLVQMRATEDGAAVGKVSIICIMTQVLMDAYDSFLHLCLGFSSWYIFNTIAIVSLFKFVLFSVVEARYFLAIWRHTQSEVLSQGWDVVRRELSWMYSRFYGALALGLVLIYNNLRHLHFIVLMFQAYWVPQIVRDAWQGSRNSLSPSFVVGISVTRALHVLYLWGCPKGIFDGELFPRLPGSPSFIMCLATVLMQLLQLATMYLQKTKGPRWFIPWACMPQVYNYHRSTTVEAGAECVICMTELDPEDGRRAVTPCAHMFHTACLEQWLDVKMECPTCRRELPPML
eukprot:TRINITY_DN21333_c0_g1_i1.p1 TRINITY_DN21333_c0_g1~~TRINITY_DN21333_c0_g1_i1.p1  ORF type:complete len:530 (-),score=52.31 TRINITY_DN21333_c0_g1_i1:79-1668(-)